MFLVEEVKSFVNIIFGINLYAGYLLDSLAYIFNVQIVVRAIVSPVRCKWTVALRKAKAPALASWLACGTEVAKE